MAQSPGGLLEVSGEVALIQHKELEDQVGDSSVALFLTEASTGSDNTGASQFPPDSMPPERTWC